MRIVNRHRHEQRASRLARIAISQEEITADLRYPASQRVAAQGRPPRRSGR